MLFLDVLASIVFRFHWLCHAYCLMNNLGPDVMKETGRSLLRMFNTVIPSARLADSWGFITRP